MTARRVYLDHNATSPMRPSALDAMTHALSLPGNASSVHSEGRAARALIEKAREQVAALTGAYTRNVSFTSGGTEANNAVLSPRLRLGSKPGDAVQLLVGATEHPSVLDGHRFPAEKVRQIPVDGDGVIDLAALDSLLADVSGRTVVSVHIANNETGVIQPIRAISDLVHRYDGVFHADAVQAAGRLALDGMMIAIDVLTLSAHKIGGPKGAGAIVFGSSAMDLGGALIRGGGQERGLRSGTENVAAIAGFGAAAAECAEGLDREQERLAELRQELQQIVLAHAPDAVIMGEKVERLANTLTVAFPGRSAETLLIALDLAGIAASSGSACSSGKVKRSHVLGAMGLDPSLTEGVIRLSLGWNSTFEDCQLFAQACKSVFKSPNERRGNVAFAAR